MNSTVASPRAFPLGRTLSLRRSMLLALVAVALLATWPSWHSLLSIWDTVVDYSHGYLIALISLGWLYLRSDQLPAPCRPPTLAWLALAGMLAGWLVAWRGSIAIGMELLAPAILWGAIWTVFGTRAALRLAAPLAYLYFAIPIWELIVPVLQHLTVAVTESVMAAVGVRTHIEGVLVTIPEGRFIVEEGCSGRHFLIVSLAVSTLLIGIWRLSGWLACSLLMLAVALSLIANWIRVAIIIYAGHVSHMHSYLVAREHVSLGWLIFAVLLAAVYFAGSRMVEPRRTHDCAAQGLPAQGFAFSGLVLTLLLLTTTAMATTLAVSAGTHTKLPPAHLPPLSGDWQGPDPAAMSWNPHYPDASGMLRGRYHSVHGTSAEVFIGEYATQHQDAELINSENSLAGEHWNTLHSGTLAPAGDAGTLNTLIVQDASQARRLIAYTYQADSQVMTSAARLQLLYGIRSWFQATPVRVIAIAMPCDSLCDAEHTQLGQAWNALENALLAAPKKSS